MTLPGDLRRAVRSLWASPGYTLTSIAVLALGIGANVAIFSVVHSVILTALPYPDPERLVFVWERFPNMPDPPGGRIQVARRNFLEWKRQNSSFADMAAFLEMSLHETGADHPRQVSTGFASWNLFPMLGARARLGRLFTAAEESSGSDGVVVITDAWFERRFQRNPQALGKPITLGGVVYTVIGVLPPKFHLPATWEGMDQDNPEVWAPLSRLWNTAEDDARRQLLVMARLRPRISPARARTEMAGIAVRLGQADPKLNDGWTTSVYPFAVEDTAPKLHRALYVLLGAVAFLLLIACANLANLTLARVTRRSREIAVRLAVGATRARVVGQLLVESFVVSIAGAAFGLLLAHWSIQLMLALKPSEIQRAELIEINLAVFLFAVGAAVGTTLLFGLAPALAASHGDLHTALKTGGGWGASASRFRGRQFLIAAEVALALVLVTGAALMVRSFERLVAAGIGFRTDRLTTIDIDLPEKRYPDPASRARFFRQLMDRAHAVPGVTAAAVVDNLPLHRISLANFSIAGRPDLPRDSLPMADFAHVSPRYFTTIGLPLKAGRGFTDADLAMNEREKGGVNIVNETFARKFFPGEDPLGKRLLSPDKSQAFEIVGVVADYRPLGADSGARPQTFSPFLRLSSATLVVATAAAPRSFTPALRKAVWSLDKDLPVDKVEPMDHYVDEWQAQRKFNTLLLAFFAGLALALAMMGIFGVLSNLVASRVREIGIRIAISARPAGIGWLVLGQSMIPVAIGIAIGLAGSLALSRFLESLLFQVGPRDPLTLAQVVLAILMVSPAAIYVPLRRAMRVDCMVALREE